MKPQINPASEQIVLQIAQKLPHALLLCGQPGLGLINVARYIAKLNNSTPEIIQPEKDEKIDIEKGSIGVEIMRELYDQLRTKNTKKRIIIINFAEKMTLQAQNAFLKLLEEPGANIHFILVSHTATKLLPTILSRTERIQIAKITAEQSINLLRSLNVTDRTKQSQILFIASGLPEEITKLSTDDEYFTNRSEIVRDARELLQGKTYQKLQIAHKYSGDRPKTLILLSDAANMLRLSIDKSPQESSLILSAQIVDTYKNVEANGNIRLCLAQICL